MEAGGAGCGEVELFVRSMVLRGLDIRGEVVDELFPARD